MRVTVDVDPELWAAAMAATGQTTKKGAVDAALKKVVQLDRQRKAFDEMRGAGWDGDRDSDDL